MAGAQFTIPLITVIPGQLIASSLWNNEFTNIANNLNPLGLDGYEDTDTQMQIQTAPYPGSVTSHATSLGGEIERIRYQIAAMLGTDFWYKPATTNLTVIGNISVPLGATIEYPSATPPNSNFLLANGQAIGRSAYAGLFSLIGTTFGVGDGSNTFNIPDLRDIMTIGAGNLYALASTGGTATSTVAITDLGHNHTQNAHTHTDSGHTHSTPNHQHTMDSDHITNANSLTGQYISGTSTGQIGNQEVGLWSGGSTTAIDAMKGQTQNSGAGTSGSGSANNQNTTPTNNSNTTGITATNPNLPPYMGLYKMMRVL